MLKSAICGSVRFKDEIAKLFNFHDRLEWQHKLGALDDDVRKVEQMHFERIEHRLSRHNNLTRLLFDWQRANERSDLLGGFPLCKLTETLLARPYARVNDFQEKLAGTRIEDEDGAVDRLCRQIAFECLQ